MEVVPPPQHEHGHRLRSSLLPLPNLIEPDDVVAPLSLGCRTLQWRFLWVVRRVCHGMCVCAEESQDSDRVTQGGLLVLRRSRVRAWPGDRTCPPISLSLVWQSLAVRMVYIGGEQGGGEGEGGERGRRRREAENQQQHVAE